jgi:hypothetical protein
MATTSDNMVDRTAGKMLQVRSYADAEVAARIFDEYVDCEEIYGIIVCVMQVKYEDLVADCKKLWELMRGVSIVQSPEEPDKFLIQLTKYKVIGPGRAMIHSGAEIKFLTEESKCFSEARVGLTWNNSAVRVALAQKLIYAEAYRMMMNDTLTYDTDCDNSYASRNLTQPAVVDVDRLFSRTNIDINNIKVIFEIQPQIPLRPMGRLNYDACVFGEMMCDTDTHQLSLAAIKTELLKKVTSVKFGFRYDNNLPLHTQWERHFQSI